MNMRLKELRVERKYTQNQLSKKIGVSFSAYRLWEHNVGKPNEENLKKILSVLKITEAELYEQVQK